MALFKSLDLGLSRPNVRAHGIFKHEDLRKSVFAASSNFGGTTPLMRTVTFEHMEPPTLGARFALSWYPGGAQTLHAHRLLSIMVSFSCLVELTAFEVRFVFSWCPDDAQTLHAHRLWTTRCDFVLQGTTLYYKVRLCTTMYDFVLQVYDFVLLCTKRKQI